MVKLPMSDTLAYRKLMSQGVMIRTMTGFRFPNWIRVTISHREPMEAFLEALGSVLKTHSVEGTAQGAKKSLTQTGSEATFSVVV